MLPEDLEKILSSEDDGEPSFQSALDAIAGAFEARTATLHRAETNSRTLHLVASRGIPQQLRPVTEAIPFGKGMAGICAERRDFVTVCNLQTDESGVARPAARETGVAGAIVVPILALDGDELLGTLGVGKADEHEYSDEERETLSACARVFARALRR